MRYNGNHIFAAVLSVATIGSFALVADVSAEPPFPPQPVSASAPDQIVASFEREFNHQRVPVAPVTRAAIDQDLLYQLVNTALRSDDGAQAHQVKLIAGVE